MKNGNKSFDELAEMVADAFGPWSVESEMWHLDQRVVVIASRVTTRINGGEGRAVTATGIGSATWDEQTPAPETAQTRAISRAFRFLLGLPATQAEIQGRDKPGPSPRVQAMPPPAEPDTHPVDDAEADALRGDINSILTTWPEDTMVEFVRKAQEALGLETVKSAGVEDLRRILASAQRWDERQTEAA